MTTKILENAGLCDLVLTAYSEFEVGGTTYKKDDVVLLLRKVPVAFGYERNESRAMVGRRTSLYSGVKTLDEVVVGQIPLSSKLLELFSGDIIDGVVEAVIVDVPVSDNKAYLPKPLANNTIFKLIGAATPLYTYNPALQMVEFEENIEDGTYTMFYLSARAGTTYNINNKDAHVPYLSLYLTASGNLDKQTSFTTIHVPRISIVDAPMVGVDNGILTHYNMVLKVVDDDCYIGV